MVTRYPRDCNSLASEAEMMPFPRLDVTPPVTKMYFVDSDMAVEPKKPVTGVKGKAVWPSTHGYNGHFRRMARL
jgi:hypothetical protein